jgi:hypothetical protein
MEVIIGETAKKYSARREEEEKMKKAVMILILALVVVAMAACSSGVRETAAMEEPAMDVAAEVPAPMPAESGAGAAYDAGYDGEAYAEAVYTEGEETGIGGLPYIIMPDTDRKLVYSSSIQLETKNYDHDYAAVKNALNTAGGYIENEYTYVNGTDYGSARFSDMMLRVPTEQYNSFLDMVAGIGTVKEKQISAEDISDRYYDNDSRIEILEQRRKRLMGHLENATKMQDIIDLEDQLDEVIRDMDSLKGTKRGMDNQVSFAQVYLTLSEVMTAETVTSTGDPVGERAANAYNMSVTGVGRFLQDFAVGLAAAAPVLMLLAVIAVIVLFAVKLVKFLHKKWIIRFGGKRKIPHGGMPGQNGRGQGPQPPYGQPGGGTRG